MENRIRNLKNCGLERMPFGAFSANAARMELVLANRQPEDRLCCSCVSFTW